MDRKQVTSEVGRDHLAEFRMDRGAFQQRYADPEDDAADCLAASSLRVDGPPDLERTHGSVDSHQAKVRVYSYFDELGAEGVYPVTVGRADSINAALAGHLLERVPRHDRRVAFALRRVMREEQLAALGTDRIRPIASQRRVLVARCELEQFRACRLGSQANGRPHAAHSARAAR